VARPSNGLGIGDPLELTNRAEQRIEIAKGRHLDLGDDIPAAIGGVKRPECGPGSIVW
jgi:hypothetical protein